MSILLALLPWILVGVVSALRLRDPERLAGAAPGAPAPSVSVIVPARNESVSIEECVASLLATHYPNVEVIVVDDRSTDDTADKVRTFGADPRLRLIEGRPLPGGWFGKPWACWQGAEQARGELLLFTDADTWHGPGLLADAVHELAASGADALTLLGDQRTETFWERVVQPQIFVLIAGRYPNLRKLYARPLSDPARWDLAIANGQFILVRREVYDAIDGHRAVKAEVVEDVRLAQTLVKAGHGFLLREARGRFATRMYRSLSGLVEGWTKNLWTGSRQSVASPLGRFLLPLAVFTQTVLWVLPAVAAAAALAGMGGPAFHIWAYAAFGFVALFWGAASARFGIPWIYGLAAPVGAAMTVRILFRSWVRGSRIEWKGRRYGSAKGEA
ncbi:MAG: glycosyltransferase family 2 protein [Gemmatimonadota bacterium]